VLEVAEGVRVWEGMDGNFKVLSDPVAELVFGSRNEPGRV